MSESVPEPFLVEVSQLAGGTYLVAVSGEMDIATSPVLMSRLSTVRGPAPFHVLVDLAALSFIDSTGIKALVSSAKQLESDGGTLVVVAPTANIRRVFDIVHLSEVLSIVEFFDAGISQAEISQAGETREGAAPALEA